MYPGPALETVSGRDQRPTPASLQNPVHTRSYVIGDHCDHQSVGLPTNPFLEKEPNGWIFAENELNMFGYQLVACNRIEDAIVIFELNVEAFPEAFNTYDSLAESYMLAGRTGEAIANYERSLELNPDNTNAVTMLARLQEK